MAACAVELREDISSTGEEGTILAAVRVVLEGNTYLSGGKEKD
jgi:hypothetical protein